MPHFSCASSLSQLYHALIKTHHITSRKKVARLRKSARHFGPLFILLRPGGSPGLMYAAGSERSVTEWTREVEALRYKDFALLRKPKPINEISEGNSANHKCEVEEGFEEVSTVQGFGEAMQQRGLLEWWRKAMGYIE